LKDFLIDNDQLLHGLSPDFLLEKYGSPLYVYNEALLRKRCREMKNLIRYDKFKVNYSIKANSNLSLLKIILEEGLNADAVSTGEIKLLLKAGYKASQILLISGNLSKEEMLFAIENNVTISADSISQLELFASLKPGGGVAIRINPGIGTGHHKKVVTGGSETKFGIDLDLVPEIDRIVKSTNIRIVGINQHIGSLFMDNDYYIKSVENLLAVAEKFPDLDFVDLGGGFGIPYKKSAHEPRLDLDSLGKALDKIFLDWTTKNSLYPSFIIEPGRYISAECGFILGTVQSLKTNYGKKYVGTDIGFNILARPVMYGSYHDILVFREGTLVSEDENAEVTVVGNICESGDILAQDRLLPPIIEGDIIAIMDAGAYGYSMSSNYNSRLRPAEVLIDRDGKDILIRERDTYEDMFKTML